MDDQDGNPGEDRFSGRHLEPACPALGGWRILPRSRSVSGGSPPAALRSPRRRRIITPAASMRWPSTLALPDGREVKSTARPRRTSASPTRPSPSTMPSSARAAACRTGRPHAPQLRGPGARMKKRRRITDDDGPAVDLAISPERVCFLVVKAREFDAKDRGQRTRPGLQSRRRHGCRGARGP